MASIDVLHASRETRTHWWLVLMGAVGASLATRWLSLGVDVIDLDETCHILGARVLMDGGRLYTDFVDNKPPLLYAYYALAQILAGPRLFAVHLVTAAVVVPLTAVGVSAFFDHTRTGIMAALLFVLASVAFIGHDMLASNAELLMILPGTWALVLLRHPDGSPGGVRSLVAGALFGLGLLCKPQVGTWAVACALVALSARTSQRAWRRGLVELTALAVGIAAPLVIVYAWFARISGAGALLYWAVWHGLWYAGNPIDPREALGRFGTYFVPFLLVTAPLWRAAASLWPARREPRALMLLALVTASVIPAFLGFRFFPHYFIQLYVPLALAAASGLQARAATRPRAARTAIAWIGGAAVLFTIANAVLYLGPVSVVRERDPLFREVAARLRADPCGRGPLFVWGWAPIIYYYADLPPASRFSVLAVARLTGYQPGNLASNRGEGPEGVVVPEHWDWLMDDLARSRPVYLVDTAPANVYRWGRHPIERYPRLRQYVQREFTAVDTIRGAVIYRRRGCESDGR